MSRVHTVRAARCAVTILLPALAGLAVAALLMPVPAVAQETPVTEGEFRGVLKPVRFDISPPLRDITVVWPEPDPFDKVMADDPVGLTGPFGPQTPDEALQTEVGGGEIPGPSVTFDGPGNIFGVAPPDPNGDVGPNHVVLMSNLSFAVYDKMGSLLLGPLPNNTLWSGFGGDCETDNMGDPIVLHDQLSDRWLLTQFASGTTINYNCVAVSTSPDPTSTYFRWAIPNGTAFPDYPKYGVWPDAYYLSTRDFDPGATGVGAYALNRAEFVAGNPAASTIYFFVPFGATPYNIGDGLLPADMDGSTLPPAGTPNFFMGSMDDGAQYGAPQDALTLWEFDANFANPPASSFTLASTLPVAAFDSVFPCSPTSRNCIPQPGTSAKVDILSYRQRTIFRLAYRNMGTHESLVTNQSVEAGTAIGATRWYEIRDPHGTPTVHQQGTFAPGVSDGIHRWMGSIAMDSSGNIALGYSASAATVTFPSVWYTGRLAGDPLGTLPQGEASIINGTGSQTGGGGRWGDYTSMVIDPVDDCTFWYTNQYLPVTSSAGWVLRVGAFKFNECSVDEIFSDGFESGDTSAWSVTVP